MNKKIIFNDSGEAVSESSQSIIPQNHKTAKNDKGSRKLGAKHQKQRKQTNKITKFSNDNDEEDENKKWFEKYSEFNTDCVEIVELKDHELTELTKLCKNSFDAELPRQMKNNPSDAKWLETALHKGTAKDRANAGALLVQSNPLGNLQALETLIGFSKHSNKSSSDVITVLVDLFIEALLPSHRKLISLTLRGADWKALRKREDITNEIKTEIYVYWYFENHLKENYFEFLKNLQQSLQIGQDSNKNVAIICAARLLMYGPEKEQMLLSMLINKLGDPSNKVASKALHHLTELIYRHPNMCGVITTETEKLLFRSNISERAQNFALKFLSQIPPRGQSDVCTKLVNICFSFFKILVQKGAINNKTMQAILRCLQKSIIDAKPLTKDGQLMTKEMQDTVYRLVHLADIKIAIQTLSLLLQLVTVKSENSDRFYNALYKKLLDLDLTTIGNNAAAQFLHIVHRAIYIDQNIPRAQAFVKRLLQLSLYMPSQMVCGTLIVINKLLKMRPVLLKTEKTSQINQDVPHDVLTKFDGDDEEEKYEDVLEDDVENKVDKKIENLKSESVPNETEESDVKSFSSWHHARNIQIKSENEDEKKVSQIVPTNYDPYHRVPAYAGAEFALKYELILLKDHYHPTAKVFTENILNGKKIDYYGDPLKDFALTQFLERFSFKNPKKPDGKNVDSVIHMKHNKNYVPHGTRGQSVKLLTKENCTEDEIFIFNYLEKKRENQGKMKKSDDNDDDVESVDDDEFEEYLDSLCKKAKGSTEEDDEDFDLDYLKEFGDDLQENQVKKKTKKKKAVKDDDGDSDENDEGSDAVENDWGEDDDDDTDEDAEDDDMDLDEIENEEDENDLSDSELENESFSDDEENSSLSNNDNEESEDDEPKPKKSKKSLDKFSKTLKNQKDMSSLFAAADDFAELLEGTGKIKGHGTSNAVFNKDKSSNKQLKWEEKRRSTLSNFRNTKSKFMKKSGKSKKK